MSETLMIFPCWGCFKMKLPLLSLVVPLRNVESADNTTTLAKAKPSLLTSVTTPETCCAHNLANSIANNKTSVFLFIKPKYLSFLVSCCISNMFFCSSVKTIYISVKRQKGSQEEQYFILHKGKKHLVKHQVFILFSYLSINYFHNYRTAFAYI